MKKGTGTLKWASVGIVGAAVVAAGMYLTIPDNLVIESSTVSAETGQYSRTLYGVPNIDLDHYRIGEDKYFDYLVSGLIDVGRENPSSFPVWYNAIIKEPGMLLSNPGLRAKVLDVLANGSSQNAELVKSLEKLLSNYVSPEGENDVKDIPIELSNEQIEELRLILTKAGSNAKLTEEEPVEGEETTEEEKATEDTNKVEDGSLTDKEDGPDVNVNINTNNNDEEGSEDKAEDKAEDKNSTGDVTVPSTTNTDGSNNE